ncbi:CG11866, partial [Drosophila busckii]
ASVVRRTTIYQQQVVATTTTTTTTVLLASTFLDLPPELIMKVMGYLDYKKISNLRLVSKRLNDICMNMLNAAFSRQIKTTMNRFQSIKANMPRRESARRNHPLACECDIIETCYMRLSLLQMSMGKHIERGHCCFFPGAILDEVNSILNYISITPRLQRPFRVTDELFDLSTMAMEYFKERIEPTLPGLAYFNKDFFPLPTPTKRPILAISSDLADSSNNSPPQNHMVLRKGIRKIKQGMKIYNNQLSVLRTDLRNCKRKTADQSKQLAEQQNLLAEHQKQTLEYASRLDENDKKNEEMARKFSTLLQELNKCKTELQFWRSKSPAIPSVCNACNQKVAPLLPPDDLQALVNQGVAPEHIFIIKDEATMDAEGNVDAEGDEGVHSDVSGCELSLAGDKPFTSPDESTTAKLLAVNRNVKRKYATTDADGVVNMSKAIASNAIPSTSKAAAQQTNSAIAGCGYSTKLFYGNHQRDGVIVSPVSMKLATVKGSHDAIEYLPSAAAQQLTTAEATAAVNGIGERAVESLGEPLESKKARRVQKANRCVQAHGKRSK